MEVHTLFLRDTKMSIPIIIERKEMKTCRLKVFPDKTVKFSVPLQTPTEWIEKYLDSKDEWITGKLQMFEQTKGYAATTEIRNGGSIRFLGEDLIFSVSVSKKQLVYKEGKTLHVCSPDINNQSMLLEQFDKWWRTESLSHINTQMDKLFPIIEKYKLSKPKIALRKMKTLWGSCSPSRGTITFNRYLTKAKPTCIEYVVLHELVHFLYPNHSKQFYNFLSIHMPDWKERKRILDQDVVHGL
jgi:predicted metal-dependent hydrolase